MFPRLPGAEGWQDAWRLPLDGRTRYARLMTKEELFTTIQNASLIPVPVIIEDPEDQVAIFFFDGNLEQFLAAAKATGARAIFVQDNSFEEDDFTYSPEEDDLDEESEDVEVDLSTVSPALAKYKKYLGKNYSFCLVAKGGIDELRIIVDQEWVKDFENEWERAIGKYLLQSNAGSN